MSSRARKTTKQDETPEFVEFWKTWRPNMRHTDGRGEARDEFFRHVEEYGADPQDIVDGAKAFFRTMKERDREYVPLAASWLNRRSYEDLGEEQREYERRCQEAQARRPENVVPIREPAPEPISEEERRRRAEMARKASAVIRGAMSGMTH